MVPRGGKRAGAERSPKGAGPRGVLTASVNGRARGKAGAKQSKKSKAEPENVCGFKASQEAPGDV